MRYFNMDGERHQFGECCQDVRCACGGALHLQAIYDGTYKLCEACNVDDSGEDVDAESGEVPSGGRTSCGACGGNGCDRCTSGYDDNDYDAGKNANMLTPVV